MNEKFIFGIIAICVFGCVQVAAFILGYNGQLLTLTTNAVIGIVSYLLGVDITQKKIIRENIVYRKQQDTHSK